MRKIFLQIFLIIVFSAGFFSFAFAQQAPQVMASWKTEAYAPLWYKGKIFPAFHSMVSVAFDLIDGGKVVDISKEKVRWYVNGEMIRNEKRGLGIQSVSFISQTYGGDAIDVRISIPGYKKGAIDSIIKIPVVAPKLVLSSPYPDKKIKPGSNMFELVPLSFNIKDIKELNINWLIDGVSYSEAATALFKLNVGQDVVPGSLINIEARAQSIKNPIESAKIVSRISVI